MSRNILNLAYAKAFNLMTSNDMPKPFKGYVASGFSTLMNGNVSKGSVNAQQSKSIWNV